MRKWLSTGYLMFIVLFLVGCSYTNKMNQDIETQTFTPMYRHYSSFEYSKGTKGVNYIDKAFQIIKKAGYQIKNDISSRTNSMHQSGDLLYFSLLFDQDGSFTKKNVTFDSAIMVLNLRTEEMKLLTVRLKHKSYDGLRIIGVQADRYVIYAFENNYFIYDLIQKKVVHQYLSLIELKSVKHIDDTLIMAFHNRVELFSFKSLTNLVYTMPKGEKLIDSVDFYVKYGDDETKYLSLKTFSHIDEKTYTDLYDSYNNPVPMTIQVYGVEEIIQDMDGYFLIGETRFEDATFIQSQTFLVDLISKYRDYGITYEIMLSDKIDSETYLVHVSHSNYTGSIGGGRTFTLMYTFKAIGEITYIGYIPIYWYSGYIVL